MIEFDQLMGLIKNLPTLPESVNRLSRLIKDENATSKDFEQVIRPDPTMTANLLRLANSAYFGFSYEITSVRQAISLMGSKRVYELALSGAFSEIIPSFLKGYDLPTASFWQHSLCVAILSEKLSKNKIDPASGMIFTAGLLHDLGKIILDHFVDHKKFKKAQTENESLYFVDWEKEKLGYSHCEVGSLIAQIWNLPQNVDASILWHHTPSENNKPEYQNIVDFVHVSNLVTHELGYFSDHSGLKRKIDESAFLRTGLTSSAIVASIETVWDDLQELVSLFSYRKNKK